MIAFAILGFLFLVVCVGEVYFARKPKPRGRAYRAYIYLASGLVGVYPLATDRWKWSLAWLPLALIMAHVIITRTE